MPDYTHIEFTKLDPAIALLVDGVPAVQGVKYVKTSIFTAQKLSPLDLGENYATVYFKAYKDDIVSKETFVRVNLTPDMNKAPSGDDLSINMVNYAYVNFGELIELNDAADRIKLYLTGNAGSLYFKEQLVSSDIVVMKKDMDQLQFFTETGTGVPYNQIKYVAANQDEESEIENTISFNVDGLATADLKDYVAVQNGEVYVRTVKVDFDKLRVNKPAKIKVEIDLLNAWAPGVENEIILDINGTSSKIYKANVTEEIEINVDETGVASFLFSVQFHQIGTEGITGTIKVTLLSTDNNPDLVSTENEVIIDITDDVDDDDGSGGYTPGGGNHHPIEYEPTENPI